jgi:hypothetical protein
MDILILVVLVGALVVASERWGYDSRQSIRSKELELAAWGFTWEDLGAEPPRGVRSRRVPGVPSTHAVRAAHRRREQADRAA